MLLWAPGGSVEWSPGLVTPYPVDEWSILLPSPNFDIHSSSVLCAYNKHTGSFFSGVLPLGLSEHFHYCLGQSFVLLFFYIITDTVNFL